MNRLNTLIEMNIRWLNQALDLLGRLDANAYSTSPRGMEPHRASGHLRHIVEFYQAFLGGLELSHIDYDARPRDVEVECSQAAASAAIRAILRGLQAVPSGHSEKAIWVRMEDAPPGVAQPFMESSVSRELQVLSSHTIHHFALIAITLRQHGIVLDPGFGMAPSTLRHLASQTAEAA